MLIILGGLPGVGKTSVARLAARQLGAIHLRIDTIEQAVLDANIPPDDDIGPVGYMVANRLATDNLRLGHIVIGDAVNPIEVSRSEWRRAAQMANARYVEVELICSDKEVHKFRVETRTSDIENLKVPDWEKVCVREYTPWNDTDLVIDTGVKSLEDAAGELVEFIQRKLAGV